MRSKGKIASWNDEKGYGFIEPFSGGERVFVHVSAFANRGRRPGVGEVVTYTLSADERGRPRAEQAVRAADRGGRGREASGGMPGMPVAAVFLLFVGFLAASGRVPPWVPALYAGASGVAYWLYARDKSAARKGHWRTPENTLHVVALAGGWPGALAAQQRLRHKNRKKTFRLFFWMTVVANLGLLGWLTTPGGPVALRAFLGPWA